MVPVRLVEGMAAVTRPLPVTAPAAPVNATDPGSREPGPRPPQAAAGPRAAAAAATATVTAPVAGTPQAVTVAAPPAGAGPVDGSPIGAISPPGTTDSVSSGTVASARLELPASDGGDLRNPKPPYPPQSRRLGEQGRVVVRVLVGPDGLAQRGQIHQSSGHTRLDQAALATVLQWRYVPGRRAGVPEAMWFDVPVNFVLE